MKTRKVVLTVEVMTDLPVAKLRAADGMALYYSETNRYARDYYPPGALTEALEVVQVNANAICDKPKRKVRCRSRKSS